jgi:hypothetical protein
MELRWLQDVEPSVEFGRNADTVDTLTLSFIAIPITNAAANGTKELAKKNLTVLRVAESKRFRSRKGCVVS